jgi:glycogen synthase
MLQEAGLSFKDPHNSSAQDLRNLNKKSAYLFEISWEVCHQIGGINTVLKTKAKYIQKEWKDRYFLIGPYKKESSNFEFEERECAISLIQYLKSRGHPLYTGKWLIPGKPNVILIDIQKTNSHLYDQDNYYLWKDFGINGEHVSAWNDEEFFELLMFGSALSEVLKDCNEYLNSKECQYSDCTLYAHFHEWMSSIGMLLYESYRKSLSEIQSSRIITVFTTHATLLGRYISQENQNFYCAMKSYDPYDAARHYNIFSRFLVERHAAQCANTFTTLSEITAKECEHFLGRKPDVLLPNGLTNHSSTLLHEFQNLHQKAKEKLHEFTVGHFFNRTPFDLDKTLYFFTSGRYEYRNKGMDIFIEALWRLNQYLKEAHSSVTVVAFIITKGNIRSLNVDVLKNHYMFDELKALTHDIEKEIQKNILASVVRGRLPTFEELLSPDRQTQLKRAMHAFKQSTLPPIVTHDVIEDYKDPVLEHLRHRNLVNHEEDRVKIVFHPGFISASNPLFGLEYEDFVRGCHLGVFPSYYEPWGYTPLECITLGVPTVTTDASGFGSEVIRRISDHTKQGVYILPRKAVCPGESAEMLGHIMFEYTKLSRRERIELRNRTEQQSEIFNWENLCKNYLQLYSYDVSKTKEEEIEKVLSL